MHLRRKNQCNKIKYRLEAGPLGPEAWDLSSSKFSWSPLSALRSRRLYFPQFWSSTRFSPRRTASRWTAPYRRCSTACSSRLASERNEGMNERRRMDPISRLRWYQLCKRRGEGRVYRNPTAGISFWEEWPRPDAWYDLWRRGRTRTTDEWTRPNGGDPVWTNLSSSNRNYPWSRRRTDWWSVNERRWFSIEFSNSVSIRYNK